MHLAEISSQVAPGAHAVLLLDQAGWHLSGKLAVPANITLLPLPPKCPELNPVENIWQFMRDNWLSNRIFTSYDNVVEPISARPARSSSNVMSLRPSQRARMSSCRSPIMRDRMSPP